MISALSMPGRYDDQQSAQRRGRVYGDLVTGAHEYERELLDAFDAGRSRPVGRHMDAQEALDAG